MHCGNILLSRCKLVWKKSLPDPIDTVELVMAYNVSLIKYTVSWLWSLCYTFSAWWDVSSQRNVHKQCPVQSSSVPYCEHTSDPTICKTCCYSRRTNNYRRKRPLLVHTDSQNNFDNLCTFRALNSNYFYTSNYMGVQNRWWCDTDSFGTPFMYSSLKWSNCLMLCYLNIPLKPLHE